MGQDKWRELPHTRRAGRYLFFALCAVSVSVVARVLSHLLHLNQAFEEAVGVAALVATFLALRDMSSNWDRYLIDATED